MVSQSLTVVISCPIHSVHFLCLLQAQTYSNTIGSESLSSPGIQELSGCTYIEFLGYFILE